MNHATTTPSIRVLDCIMGAGKTSYVIRMMNAAHARHVSDAFELSDGDMPRSAQPKFLYIAPLLSEVEDLTPEEMKKARLRPEDCNRIPRSCPTLDFANPMPVGGRKLNDLNRLIAEGRNIASTHQLFKLVTPETYRLLREQGYTLVMDEVMEAVAPFGKAQGGLTRDDLKVLLREGLISRGPRGLVIWNPERLDYDGEFNHVRDLCANENLVFANEQDDLLLWQFPAKFLALFKEVWVCTYLFEGSVMASYLKANGVPYTVLTLQGNRVVPLKGHDEGTARGRYRGLIDVYLGSDLNKVGDRRSHTGRENPLSSGWFAKRLKARDTKAFEAIKAAVYLFMNKRQTREAPPLWTTFNAYSEKLKGKGYTKGFVSHTVRATNAHRETGKLAYVLNKFMHKEVLDYLEACGLEPDQDMFALGEMLQWVFRSRIRDDKPISIFVPSERMRGLLLDWMNNRGVGQRAAARCDEAA